MRVLRRIGSWIYSNRRPRSVLDGQIPEEAYDGLTAPSSGHASVRAEAQLGGMTMIVAA